MKLAKHSNSTSIRVTRYWLLDTKEVGGFVLMSDDVTDE